MLSHHRYLPDLTQSFPTRRSSEQEGGVFATDGRLHFWNNRFRKIWGFEEEMLAGHPRVDQLMERAAHKLSKPQQVSAIRELVRAATVERKQRGGRVAFADGQSFEFAAIPLPDGNALFTMLDVRSEEHTSQLQSLL